MGQGRGQPPRRRIGSAHAIALVALVVALGGGYATAQSVTEPQPTVGFHEVIADERHEPDGGTGAALIGQLVFPTGTDLAVSAKLNVSKGTGEGFAPGRVRCFLGTIGPRDRAVAELEPGGAANLSLQSMGSLGSAPPGGTASPGGTNALDLYCRSKRSDYLVSDARISAISLDSIERLTPPAP